MAALLAKSLNPIESPTTREKQSSHEALETWYDIWRSIETRIEGCQNLAPRERDELVDQLIDCQTMVIDRMTTIRGHSLIDIFCKLAVWRWETLGLIPNRDQMSETERLAYSAYRDLRDVLGRSDAERNGWPKTDSCLDSSDTDIKTLCCKSPPCGLAF